jgi:hypothetical protein
MGLDDLVVDISNALLQVDASRVAFRSFRPGVGPYGEPQLLKLIAAKLNQLPKYNGRVVIKRTPDLLIREEWAIEFKIARPFGDNDKEAENWSVNLLHPYPGNVSTIGDCYKLSKLGGDERKAVVVIEYEHTPPRIDLSPLVRAFEAIAKGIGDFRLSERVEARRDGLIHPVHQSLRVFAWEVLAPVA